MESGDHAVSILVVELSAQFGYRRNGLHHCLGRERAQAANDLRLDDSELLSKKWIARGDFVRLRIAIVGRTALQHIADVDILTFDVDRFDDLGQQLARASDERQTLLVLIEARRFTDENQFRINS